MSSAPVPNCTRCHIRWQAQTNRCENTFTYLWSSPSPSQAELLQLATELAGTIGVRMRSMMHNGIQFREVYCRNIHAVTADQATYTWPANTFATRAGSALALNEASGIIKRTGLTGRANRGRNSFSGFVEGDADGNTISTGLMQLLADLAISILVQRVSGRFRPAVASASRGLGILLQQAVINDTNIDSQKTRLNNRGT